MPRGKSRRPGMVAHLVAALASLVWQKRNRTSLRVLVKAYRLDISATMVRIAVACGGWNQLADSPRDRNVRDGSLSSESTDVENGALAQSSAISSLIGA